MTDLSPAALAVRDAAEKQTDLDFRYAPMIAAVVLRAAADRVVPEEEDMPTNLAHRVRQSALQSVRRQLLAIADELEQS